MLVDHLQVSAACSLCCYYAAFIHLNLKQSEMFYFLYVTQFKQSLPYLILIVDDRVLMTQLIESLPDLPTCELVDPADDQTLPRMIEVLERRHQIRQMMTEQFNKTGTGHLFPSRKVWNSRIRLLEQIYSVQQ